MLPISTDCNDNNKAICEPLKMRITASREILDAMKTIENNKHLEEKIHEEPIEYVSKEESSTDGVFSTDAIDALPVYERSDLWCYCRVCACANETMIPIYDECGMELQLEEKINNYLPITVSTNDELPLQICQSCVDKLNTTHELIVSCLDSNTKFMQHLEMQTNEEYGGYQDPYAESVVESAKRDEEDNPKIKKKVVVLKVLHSNNSHLSPTMRIAQALEAFKHQKKVLRQSYNTGPNAVQNTLDSLSSDVDNSSVQKVSGNATGSDFDKLQVASIAEFFVTSGKNSLEYTSDMESPKLESKISKALGQVDNGTKQRIVEAVQNIVTKRNDVGKSLVCPDCGLEFVGQGDFDSHSCPKKNPKPRGENICKVCNKKFRDTYKLTVHKQIHKKGHIFSCHECGKKFSRKDSLHLHLMNHSGMKPHMCKHCGKRFLHRNSLEVHQITEHSDSKPWLCDFCGKSFTHISNLRLHHRIHVQNKDIEAHRCAVCDQDFTSKLSLKEHSKIHNNEKIYKCTQCSKTFSTQEKLKQHDSIHSGKRPYQCSICSIGFIRKGNLTKHYKTHSLEKTVMCRVCKATFPSVAGLLNHRKSHSNEEWDQVKRDTNIDTPKGLSPPENYQCSVCNKGLSSKLSLSLHMRVHTGEKPFQCELCSKRFTQKPALTYHMRLHTGERPHACQFCGKGFNSKVGKESHERIHTGERPYKCGQCGVGFRCSANLRQHTWIHTNNRPFDCEVCNKLFRRREALQVHMRIHTGERPYSCHICGRSFTQKGDMLKHTRSHSKKNMRLTGMACLYCGQVFTRKIHYKMHMEKCSFIKEDLHSMKQDNTTGTDLVDLKDAVVIKNNCDQMKTVISSEDMIPSFSEITIVTNDIQEYEVEYQS